MIEFGGEKYLDFNYKLLFLLSQVRSVVLDWNVIYYTPMYIIKWLWITIPTIKNWKYFEHKCYKTWSNTQSNTTQKYVQSS